jgi:hypothetical protein
MKWAKTAAAEADGRKVEGIKKEREKERKKW